MDQQQVNILIHTYWTALHKQVKIWISVKWTFSSSRDKVGPEYRVAMPSLFKWETKEGEIVDHHNIVNGELLRDVWVITGYW